MSHLIVNPDFIPCSIFLVLALPFCSTQQTSQIPNFGHHYPVHIGAENHIVQGRISSEAEPGELVPSNVVVEGEKDADVKVHLRVEVRGSIYKRPHLFHPDNKFNDSVIEEFPNSTLPFGMQFVVIHTNAFYVNEDRYITVNDFTTLNEETRIHFDVILKDNLAETKYVSNQLHFVVEIEYPKREMNPNAVLFAGVLVLTIVAISLLIPFVVLAKRRCKAGKPIFKCGSADDASDLDSLGSVPEYLRNRASSIGGKSNLAMILENGRINHISPSVDQHTTIQNHLLRSTSGLQFQPHCVDPHYNDAYVRPDYSSYRTQTPVTRLAARVNGSQSPLIATSSTASSDGSDIIYPENFSKHNANKSSSRIPVHLKTEKANGVTAKCGVLGTSVLRPPTANIRLATISAGLPVLAPQGSATNGNISACGGALPFSGTDNLTNEDDNFTSYPARYVTIEKF